MVTKARFGAESNLLDWLHKDWLDPETWKPAVELVKEWQTLVAFLILVLATVAGWVGGFFRWAASKFRGAPVADRPLRFVVDEHQTFHTPVGSDEKTGTHVVGVWDVTNVSNDDLALLKVRLGDYTSRSARVGVENDRDPAYQERGPLKAHRMSKVRIELTFTPAIHRTGEDLISDVIFTDNYGAEHRGSVQFRRMAAAPVRAKGSPNEQ